LYAAGDYEIAQQVYLQILQFDSGNGQALVGMARIYLQLFQPDEARRILKGLTPGEESTIRRIHRLTLAEYHQAVGEYVEAKHIYQEFLHANPNDHEVRLALAELYAFIREYEKAKAEFAKIPPSSSLGRRSRLGFAAALGAQWRLHEALDATQQVLTEVPGDGKSAAQLVPLLGRPLHRLRVCWAGRTSSMLRWRPPGPTSRPTRATSRALSACASPWRRSSLTPATLPRRRTPIAGSSNDPAAASRPPTTAWHAPAV